MCAMTIPTQNPTPKRPRGRPVTRPMAERITDTPENIARALFATPPTKPREWDNMKRQMAQSQAVILLRPSLPEGYQGI